MTHLAAIVLGIVEGATEFIPVSSSGHLILARHFLGLDMNSDATGLAFDAVLQLATSLALLVYFRKEVLQLIRSVFAYITRRSIAGRVPIGELSKEDTTQKTLLWAIVLGTIPAIIAGLLLEKDMETIFRNVHLVAITLALGSVLMWGAQKWRRRKERESDIVSAGTVSKLTVVKGIVIGFFQCLALVPGVSRSGATISGGLFAGLSQEEAVRFSFLLSLPILFGSGLKKLFDVRHLLFGGDFGLSLLLGSVTAFIVGLLSIHYLLKFLRTHNLNLFIWYRVLIAILIIIFL